jgi:hypothetical protein
LDAISSGFDHRDSERLVNGSGFCFLKLHGSAAVPGSAGNEGYITYDDVFCEDRRYLVEKLTKNEASPVAFPWEVHSERETFSELLPSVSFHGRNPWAEPGQDLHSLFDAIWSRAAREVAEAQKVSFVGISMNSLLDAGFRKLFLGLDRQLIASSPADRIAKRPKLISASPESTAGDFDPERRISRQCVRVSEAVKNACSAYGLQNSGRHEAAKGYSSFSEFIDRELG